jgi:photosystem II stability/assembly factor-like uncharacterized protein
MKIFRLFSSFLLTVSGVVFFILTNCSRPFCPKNENPAPADTIPVIVSSEITTWTDKSVSSLSSVLVRVFFTDDLTGYVCGYGGVLIKTTDGFNSIKILNPGTTQDLTGLWFTDANTGYVSGNGGTILKTTNAGATWTPLPVPTTKNCARVYFLDANTGYSAGSQGTLLKTTNAGASWTLLNSGTSQDLHGIFFTDANTGYISGQVYTMRKTTDGGANWTALNTGLAGGTIVTPLSSIFFTDANTGYAVGGYAYPTGTPSNGVIIKTTDAGASWVQQTNPAGTNALSTIKFTDANTGYIVGGDIAGNTSTILKTINGGNTWSIQPTLSHRLSDIYLISTGEGYAVGLSGAILKGNL